MERPRHAALLAGLAAIGAAMDAEPALVVRARAEVTDGPVFDEPPRGPSGFVQDRRRPNPQRYPSGCRRLFRVHRISPADAAAGKIPEACR